MANTETRTATTEQLEVLQRVADEYGRVWKGKVWGAWMNGCESRICWSEDAPTLREIRNNLGPSWLFSKACKIKPCSRSERKARTEAWLRAIRERQAAA